MTVAEILNEARRRLEEAFGRRFRGAVLYGSRARGDSRADSDIDLMALLEGPVELGRDLQTVIHALYPLQLETDLVIDAWPADVRSYEAQEFAVYRNANREGVRL